MPIRVVLGEDSLIVREGVHQLFAVDPTSRSSRRSGISFAPPGIEEERPDVVLTDIRMPPTHTDEGIRLAAELRDTHPQIGVVSSASSPTRRTRWRCSKRLDGRAYLLKERVHNRAELMARDPRGRRGRVDDRPEGRRGAGRRARPRAASPLNELTSRELEVLGEIAQGKSNTAIADSLFLTKRAVEKHINAIFWKLGLADAADVSKRVKAALMFLAEETLSPVN